jgi:transcriptional regulator with XRE-family HTH domain
MLRIGEYLRIKRLEKNLSLRQVAKAASIAAPYLCDVERGFRKLSFKMLVTLGGVMGLENELPELVFHLAKENRELPEAAISKIFENEQLLKMLLNSKEEL